MDRWIGTCLTVVGLALCGLSAGLFFDSWRMGGAVAAVLFGVFLFVLGMVAAANSGDKS